MAVLEVDSAASYDEGIRIIRRFLSALAWREQTYIREIDVVCGGAALRIGNRIPDNITTTGFSASGLPTPTDGRAWLALAFFREGLSLGTKSYQFLAFFKVLNVLFSAPQAQIDWINRVLPFLTDAQSVARRSDLIAAHADVGAYLYGSGRSAVAHAFAAPLVDPDSPEDDRRFSDDLPVIRALAAKLLVDQFGLTLPS